jgi:mannose-1-phosphate guanylyltransferase
VIVPVILSGGSGTRLWPLSTAERPKQFLPLFGTETLFQQTLARVADRNSYAPPVVVGNAGHEALHQEELASLEGARLILEPLARNTAVAIYMAALVALESDPEATLLVMPSDHRIGSEASFHRAVRHGLAATREKRLVTFGVQPTGPETGYGYLQAGEALPGHECVFAVARFVEKPALARAKEMIAAGNHFWNGGIFMFRADVFAEECGRLAPEVAACGRRALELAARDGATVRPDRDALAECPDISVDYAVMERSSKIAMVPLDADWSDLGSWDALADANGETPNGTATMLDSRGCYVQTDGLKVALLGVEDLIVVAKGDQVTVMKRGRSQEIKRLAAMAVND